MTTSYDAPASSQCLATRETQDASPRVLLLQALVALMLRLPQLGDVNFSTETKRWGYINSERFSLQLSYRSDLVTELSQWADVIGADTVLVQRGGDVPPYGWAHVHMFGHLDGVPVEVWTGFHTLGDDHIPTGTEIPLQVLRDAEQHMADGWASALASVGYSLVTQDIATSGEDGQK